MNAILFLIALFSSAKGQTSTKVVAGLAAALVVGAGAVYVTDDGGLHEQSVLVSNGCWNTTYCEATFTINATASDKEIRKDIDLIPSFEDKNGNKKNVTFTTDYDIYYLIENVTTLENGTVIITTDKVDTGKKLTAGQLNYIHYYTNNFNEEWIDWHLEIKNIPKEVLGVQKDVTFDTHNKGWAIWGANTISAYYSFDSGYSSSTNTYNASNSGNSISTTAILGNGSALMGAAGSRITVSSPPVTAPQSLTINGWFNITGAEQYDTLFDLAKSGSDTIMPMFDFNLGVDNCNGGATDICFANYVATWYVAQEVSYAAYIGKETMVTYTVTGSSPYNHSIYLNGVLVSSRTTTTTGSGFTNIYLGSGQVSTRTINGRMDDVTIDNEAWNSSYVFSVYQSRANYSMISGGWSNESGGGGGSNTSISWTQNITSASLNHNTSWVTDLNVTNSTTCGVTGIYSNNTDFPIDQYTGIVSVPARTANWSYQHWIGFYAQDNCTDTADIWQNISVTYTNNAPVNNWSSNNYTRNHNTSWYSPSHCVDQDNDAITTTSNDSIVSFLSNGSMSFTSGIAKTGVYSLYINCTDGYASDADVSTFTVTNTAPTISCTNQSHRYYKNYTVCTGSDADGDSLTFSENGTYYTANASGIHYTANYAAIGSYAIFANVTDSLLTSASVLTYQNITDISSSAVTLCNVSRVSFIPNTSLINYSTNYTTQSVLMNGTLINGCSFMMNTTSEEGPLRLFAKVNYTNSTYVVSWGTTNLTTSYQLIGTVTNGTVVRYNLTGYWNNASYKSFPVRVSVNVTV